MTARLLICCLIAELLLGAVRVVAQPLAEPPRIDVRKVTAVTAAALAFMGPRTLDPYPAGQLAVWGLRGLTTLDPRLVAEWGAGRVRLTLSGRELLSLPAPEGADGWGEVIGLLVRAASDASDPVRRAGTQGVIRSFFDELFNHMDPYSRYVSPTDEAADEVRRNGRAGTGIELVRSGNGFYVRTVAEGSPAARAGIRPGEQLLAVDDEALEGADLSAVNALMAGPEAAPVSLTLRAPGRAPRSVDLVRALVTAPTVFAQRQGDIVFVRVTAFAHDTADALAAALQRLIPAGRPARGLVLDLRGNRGGLLRSAVDAADVVLGRGLIATTEGRDPDAAHVYFADANDLARDLPIVVIVDGRTASAAEVLAAALADQRRAVVIGSATLGKGLVQTILPLPDGGALSLTWSRILAPLGWPLQALGVLPQVCTSLGEEATRRQLVELAQGRQTMQRALVRHRSARPNLPPAEILEIRNACPAAEGREQDGTTARFLIETQPAYGAALIDMPPSP